MNVDTSGEHLAGGLSAFPDLDKTLSPTHASTSTTLVDAQALRGRQRVSSSVTLLEAPHASLMSPARRRSGMNVMIPMGGLGSRFKTGLFFCGHTNKKS
jgi:hypothetical protein